MEVEVGEKRGYFKTYSVLHQELVRNAVKFRKTIGFPINKRRRITSAIKCNQFVQKTRRRLETQSNGNLTGISS